MPARTHCWFLIGIYCIVSLNKKSYISIKANKYTYFKRVVLFILVVIICNEVAAQKDTVIVKKDSLTAKKKHDIFRWAYRVVSKRHPDTTSVPIAPSLIIKAEQPYQEYQGKIIRNIETKQFGFGKSFTDTSKQSRYFGTRFLSKLHHNTRSWQIRYNLFIQPNTPLNTYLISENERYLRSLGYIQDARILVKEVPESPDSVDLQVITKDLFSINGSFSNLSPANIRTNVSENNVMGTGQRIALTGLYDKDRRPNFGYSVLYNINSIDHSFVNASVIYSEIDNNISRNRRNQQALLLQLDRPLTSAYARLAGGLIVGSSQTSNDYSQPDSLFFQYKYNTIDGWIGYNIGVKKLLTDNTMHDRKFVSFRYFKTDFTQLPLQVGDHFNQLYNDKKGALAQFTFFRQDFYKTNYIYGFGITEDVPTGYNVSVTSGWYQQLYLKRAYAGIDANFYRFTNNEHFIQYFFRAGGFISKNQIQDAGLLLGTSVFSKLYLFRNFKMRQYFQLSYTRQFNQIALDPLKINNPFGIRYFGSDSAFGDRRISLHGETFIFLKYKLFGFQFSPFVFNDVSALTARNRAIDKSAFYWSVGAGIRIRNENLLFGTIELRFVYFPRQVQNMRPYLINSTVNLRFRYNTSYVRAPDLIQLNTDNSNSIF